jgi:hypothetical protein
MTDILFIEGDAARQGRSDGEAATGPSAQNLDPLIESVTGTSIEEIERLLLQLQRMFEPMASTHMASTHGDPV